jgi:hypothetical protein
MENPVATGFLKARQLYQNSFVVVSENLVVTSQKTWQLYQNNFCNRIWEPDSSFQEPINSIKNNLVVVREKTGKYA